jgi:hypothetical protein
MPSASRRAGQRFGVLLQAQTGHFESLEMPRHRLDVRRTESAHHVAESLQQLRQQRADVGRGFLDGKRCFARTENGLRVLQHVRRSAETLRIGADRLRNARVALA